MNLPKTYTPDDFEPSIYALWESSDAFSPSGSGEPFSVVMPPPNAKVLQSKDQWDKAPSGSIWIVPDPNTGAQSLLTKP